jgi:Methyltransferase domain
MTTTATLDSPAVSRPFPASDPYLNDPSRWGVSMAQVAEIMLPCLDVAAASSIAEVGAFAGDLTRVLVAWAAGAGARVQAIDPAPQPGLEALAAEHPELELIRLTSLDALPSIELPDAVVIDGDHNYYTVSEELRIIGERAAAGRLPLLLFHDVLWPHGRRDDYFDPAAIPAQARHPIAGEGHGLLPGDPGTDPGGLPYPRSAAREGGERNGVLTAVEDFVAGRQQTRLAIVPAFFGFAVAWDTAAPWSERLAALLGPFDRHPVLERLEANRVEQLARSYLHKTEVWELERRLARQRALLERLLHSSAFAVAERLSRLRAGAGIATGQPVVSKDEIRAALED